MSGQVVQITINVTDANASEAVEQIVASLNALGPAGQAAGAEAGAGLDQVGEHAITAKEQVRLLSEEMGVHVPRAMQSVIANSQMLSAAIGAIAPGMIAIGGADILMHLGEEAYKLYEKYVDINAAQDEFLKKLDEAKDKDFVNVHSIETADLRIKQATESMINLRSAAKDLSGEGWGNIWQGIFNPGQFAAGVGELGMARNLADQSMKAAGQTQEINPAEQNLIHQQNLAEIESEHAGDSRLKGEAKITAELQKQLDIDKEKQRYTAIEEGERGNPRAHDAGKELQATEDTGARARAHAEEIEFQRQEASEAIQLHNEAINAALQGNALRAAQEQQEIEAITRKFQEGEIQKQTAAAETADVQKKFAAQALKLQDELDAQTEHMADEAAQGALKGIPLIEAQLRTQMDAIDAAEKKAVGVGGVDTPGQLADYASQRASAESSANQKIGELRRGFNQSIAGLDDSLVEHESQGYAKIAADAQANMKTLEDKERETYGADQSNWENYQSQKARILESADQQMAALHQRTMEEIAKEEEQTARYSLAGWQQAQLRIIDDYQDRVRKIQDMESQQDAALDADMQAHAANFAADQQAEVMVAKEADAQMLAARQQMNAALQQSDEETRDKLASGLQSLFKNPEQFFEKRAMDTAFQMMANEMMGVFKNSGAAGGIMQYMFGMGPQMSTSANPLTDVESVLGMGGHGHAGTSSAASPGMAQFQQGATAFSSSTSTFSTAVSQFAATVSAGGSGGMAGAGGVGGMGGAGSSLSGLAGAGIAPGSTASGAGLGAGLGADQDAGLDPSMMYTTSNPMMLPGVTGATGALSTLDTFGNSLAIPGMTGAGADDIDSLQSGVASETNTLGGAATGMSAMGKVGAGVGGLAMGAGAIYSAYQSSNPMAGIMGGAAAGAEVGSIFGPIGTGIGALAGGIAGGIAGALGDRGRSQAEALDVNQIQPQLVSLTQDYEAGRAGYNSEATQLNAMLISAQNATNSMGSGARNYFSSNISPEINKVLSSLQQQEIGGRSQVTLTAGQFHSGGWTGDFGDLATSETEGFIHAAQNEFVVNPMAAAAHAPILQAMNNGTNFAYSNSVQPRMPASSGAGAGAQVTVQAMDSKSVAQWAKGGGGLALMAALNQAQRQYSGVGRG
jgi:hypothetical protein